MNDRAGGVGALETEEQADVDVYLVPRDDEPRSVSAGSPCARGLRKLRYARLRTATVPEGSVTYQA